MLEEPTQQGDGNDIYQKSELLDRRSYRYWVAWFRCRTQRGKFDLSPEQPNRLRVEKIAKRVEEIKDFKFVKDGVLTIGISTSGHLPLHDYASDSKTVIGYDVDLAQIIADSLGLQLELVSVAWADWPLGLSSGKFDAVISNVTVTEERKEKFDFSTYRKDELGFYVKSDSEIGEIKSPKDIAGLKVITDAGTNQEKSCWNGTART